MDVPRADLLEYVFNSGLGSVGGIWLQIRFATVVRGSLRTSQARTSPAFPVPPECHHERLEMLADVDNLFP
jgi:hypothetical protein